MRYSILKHIMVFSLAFCLLAGGLVVSAAATPPEPVYEGTILFTHDTHDHFLPMPDNAGSEYGGYTRLATLLKEERAKHPDALILDGGDFSMGSLFQTIYTSHAPELQALGVMGYDVTTLGNHEFDYRAKGLSDMLNAAVNSGSPLPAIVQANYKPPASDTETWEAWNNYGIQDYVILNRAGINYGIFGLMGAEADSNAPMSGMEFEPIVEAAKRTVAAIQSELDGSSGPTFIICLSHSGTDGNGKGEDYELAKQVDGIDLIISGHSHTTLEEPLLVNDTLIVSSGAYTANLGALTVTLQQDGKKTDWDYRLIPVDETVPENPEMVQLVNTFQPLVESEYLAQYGMKFDQVLTSTDFPFTSIEQFAGEQCEDPLGNLIADSYIYAVQQAEGENYVPVDFAVVASGVIRGSFAAGEITVSDAFNVSSLGSGADGTPGYPLISAWLTGKELKDVFEIDASVSSLMSAAQLYGSGMRWSWNPHRIIFNKVTDCAQVLPDGSTVPLDDDKLYRVVTGLYCGQMLGAVNEQSFGILTVTPKDNAGNPITNFENCIIHNSDGTEVKEWYVLASYLDSMETMDERYSAPEGRKTAFPSWNPIHLLSGLNLFGILVLLVVLVIILLLIFIFYRIIAHFRRGGNRRNTGNGYRSYRG